MIWAGVIVAVAVAAAMAGALAWAGPVDPVKARSSHARPTPTSGGLAILAGTCAGAAVEALAPGGGGEALGWILALAAALGLVGAADDLWDFDAGTKAAAQAVTAAGLVAVAGAVTVLPIAPGLALPVGPVLGALGSGLFVLVLLNAMNFMDGSNGLAPGVGAVSLAGLAIAAFWSDEAALGWAALAGAAAGLGFLPWNLRGRVFQGDVGALFTAALIGAIGLRLASTGAATPYLVVFTALPLLTDVLLTLVVRARRRARLAQAHREHLYQLWLQATGRTHGALAVRVWALTAACTAAGLALERYAPEWSAAGLAVAVVVLSTAWVRMRGRLSRE